MIVDLIKQFGFPYIALNPGASYRGLHDSLVNYGGNSPPMLLCQHEKIAVQIAHGYAKATGKPMVAIVHDVVGLLHATMGIYYAYVDRAPIFVIGATGPMDESRRRPFIDWIHTANVQGEQVRHYVKWDYQPGSIEGVPDSFARAYGAMMTEPQGPIYMCYDALLQEQPLTAEVEMPSYGDAKAPVPMAADPAALATIADRLLAARFPVLLAEYVGRTPHGFDNLVALAETVGAAVYDVNARLNFPNRHKLNLSMEKSVFRDADLILSLDTRDWEKPTHRIDRTKRRTQALYPAGCEMIEIGFGDIGLCKWSMDYTRMPELQPARARRHRDRHPRADAAVPRAGSPAAAASPSASPSAPPRSRRATTRCSPAGRRSRARTGTPRPSRCRASPMKSGTSSRTRTGCSPPRRCRTGRSNCGTSTSPTAMPAARSAPAPRSACRSASRWRTAAPAAWWSTSSPTATSCSTPARCGRRRRTTFRSSS